ncbi:MAG: hypothetical protein QM820_40225 [Minicystis sp.]
MVRFLSTVTGCFASSSTSFHCSGVASFSAASSEASRMALSSSSEPFIFFALLTMNGARSASKKAVADSSSTSRAPWPLCGIVRAGGVFSKASSKAFTIAGDFGSLASSRAMSTLETSSALAIASRSGAAASSRPMVARINAAAPNLPAGGCLLGLRIAAGGLPLLFPGVVAEVLVGAVEERGRRADRRSADLHEREDRGDAPGRLWGREDDLDERLHRGLALHQAEELRGDDLPVHLVRQVGHRLRIDGVPQQRDELGLPARIEQRLHRVGDLAGTLVWTRASRRESSGTPRRAARSPT